ncbi:hypothetical protein AGMMS49944_04730 [Spirochaetia bacterium]|nr:hypothetical protein AGMMS49944_04730 [Spirochaetia bacterium]
MKKNGFVFGFLAIGACIALITACEQQTDPKPGSGEKAITAFVIGSEQAEINGTVITVTLPHGTIADNLAPLITVSEKASVSPASGVARDFSDSVTYTVTAEDGTTKVYIVIVTIAGDDPSDTRTLLVAGPNVPVDYTATTATVTFTGATGLTELTAADFAVTGGATLGSPTVNDDIVTISVNFAANTGASTKTYIVSIAPTSAKIRGGTAVTITQEFNDPSDTRTLLFAGPDIYVDHTDATATATFTRAAGLTGLTAADFAVTGGATLGSPTISGDIATIPVYFAANTGASEKAYSVSIAPGSSVIRGSSTVTITQAGVRTLLAAGPGVSVDYTATTAIVTFTGATGLIDLGWWDFEVDNGATLGSPTVSGGTVTIPVYFGANTGASEKTYTVSIAPTSTRIQGSATVTITQQFNDPSDTRTLLVAGPDVYVDYTATTATATFTGAYGLTGLTAADFVVTGGATLGSPTISGGTVTIPVYSAANTGASAKTYIVSIVPTSARIQGSATVTITQAGVPSNPALEGTVSITGTASVGQTLTANTGSLQGIGTISYVWKRGDSSTAAGTAIAGATSVNYTLVAADLGRYITVTVTRTGYSGSKTSAATATVTNTQDFEFVWTAAATNTNIGITIQGIAYGNGKFVAVGANGKMAYSTNGTTWTVISDTAFTRYYNIEGITYGGDKFVAVGIYGEMAYSTNGITWTAISHSTFTVPSNNSINSIAYGGGKFVAVGDAGQMAYSTDGITWTAVSDSTFINDLPVYGIAYGNGKFVAVGNGGQMAYSTNGITWTAVSDTTFMGYNIPSIAYGDGKFVAVGYGGKMAYSTNGITWIAVSETAFDPATSINGVNTSGENIYAIAYGGGKFIAVGVYGKVAYSTDGTTWTALSRKLETSFSHTAGIAYGDGRFVVGYNSRIVCAVD